MEAQNEYKIVGALKVSYLVSTAIFNVRVIVYFFFQQHLPLLFKTIKSNQRSLGGYQCHLQNVRGNIKLISYCHIFLVSNFHTNRPHGNRG
jgi:hypothetical protein